MNKNDDELNNRLLQLVTSFAAFFYENETAISDHFATVQHTRVEPFLAAVRAKALYSSNHFLTSPEGAKAVREFKSPGAITALGSLVLGIDRLVKTTLEVFAIWLLLNEEILYLFHSRYICDEPKRVSSRAELAVALFDETEAGEEALGAFFPLRPDSN